MRRLTQKEAGAYYTPDSVVSSLLQWAVRHEDDGLLDPACGDSGLIAGHRNSVGIEQDAQATQTVMERAPWALVHEGGFHPDDITPRPPFVVETKKGRKGRVRNILKYDPDEGGTGEQVILGGLLRRRMSMWS